MTNAQLWLLIAAIYHAAFLHIRGRGDALEAGATLSCLLVALCLFVSAIALVVK